MILLCSLIIFYLLCQIILYSTVAVGLIQRLWQYLGIHDINYYVMRSFFVCNTQLAESIVGASMQTGANLEQGKRGSCPGPRISEGPRDLTVLFFSHTNLMSHRRSGITSAGPCRRAPRFYRARAFAAPPPPSTPRWATLNPKCCPGPTFHKLRPFGPSCRVSRCRSTNDAALWPVTLERTQSALGNYSAFLT